MCVGIDFCSRKNCLEQEKCLFPEEKSFKTVKINQCKIHKKFCTNATVCELLGQCMLDHSSVKGNKQFTRELRKAKSISAILGIFERFMPERKWKSKQRKLKKRYAK